MSGERCCDGERGGVAEVEESREAVQKVGVVESKGSDVHNTDKID